MIAAHLLNPSRTFTNLADAVSEQLHSALPAETAACGGRRFADSRTRDRPSSACANSSLYDDVELPLAVVWRRSRRRRRARSGGAGRSAPRVDADVDAPAERNLRLGRRDVQHRLAAATRPRAVRQAQTAGGEQEQDRLGDRRRGPAGARARVSDCRESARVPRGHASSRTPTSTSFPHSSIRATAALHTVFNQTATATGRLSSTNPNLQNIPVRSELGRRIRRAFVARSDDHVLLAADYSQIELRLMAHLSGDEAMRDAFHEGQDIHDFTARQIFGSDRSPK